MHKKIEPSKSSFEKFFECLRNYTDEYTIGHLEYVKKTFFNNLDTLMKANKEIQILYPHLLEAFDKLSISTQNKINLLTQNFSIGVINQIFLAAARTGRLEFVQSLATLDGVNISAEDNCAIRSASANGHLEVVKYLVDIKADPTANNNYGIYWALNKKHEDVALFLAKLENIKNTLTNEKLKNKIEVIKIQHYKHRLNNYFLFFQAPILLPEIKYEIVANGRQIVQQDLDLSDKSLMSKLKTSG